MAAPGPEREQPGAAAGNADGDGKSTEADFWDAYREAKAVEQGEEEVCRSPFC